MQPDMFRCYLVKKTGKEQVESAVELRPLRELPAGDVLIKVAFSSVNYKDALAAIAQKAIERKTGARGLRSIMEAILLDTMFDLPGLEGVEEVVISDDVVRGNARPLYIYSERSADEAQTADRSA